MGLLVVDHVVDRLRRGEVEPGERLVEQQQVVVLGEALGDEHALALATRKLSQVPAGNVGDAHPFDRFVHDRSVGRSEPPVGATAGVAAHRHDLAHRHGQRLVHLRRLEHVGDPVEMDGERAS